MTHRKARPGGARRGKAWLGLAGRGKAWLGLAGRGVGAARRINHF